MPFRIPRRLSRTLLVALATALLASVLGGPAGAERPGPAEADREHPGQRPQQPLGPDLGRGRAAVQRARRQVWSKRSGASRRAVSAPLSDLFVNSEGGLMGMVADPAAASNQRFYVCYAARSGSEARDVRVVRLAADQRHHCGPRRRRPGGGQRHPDQQRSAQRLPAALRPRRSALRRHR